jgi:chitinase
MYDINVFLENRREIVRAIEKLNFNFDSVGDYDFDSFEVELTRGNMQLVINATIRSTMTESVADTYEEQGYDEYTTDLEEVIEAFYYTSKGDKIECSESEYKVIENVIKSLL